MPRIICAEIAMRPMRSHKMAQARRNDIAVDTRFVDDGATALRMHYWVPLPVCGRVPLPLWRHEVAARRSHQHRFRAELSHTPSLLARRGPNFRHGVARELVGALVH